MRVLLTGSSGRVGTAIGTLLCPDHSIVGLDRSPGPLTTHVGDLDDRDLLDALTADVDAVVHTASLHAPHVGRVPDEAFAHTNVHGTQALLEACLAHGVTRFVYTSTTSLYGHALVPRDRAVFVTEELMPRPRDIYDTTKIAAEAACRKAADIGLCCISLRISRCFPEPAELIATYRLHRGVDLRDVAEAHRLALTATVRGFDVFNISASSPFLEEDAEALLHDATSVIRRRCPELEQAFRLRGWKLPSSIDRVYVVDKARALLGYRPQYNSRELFGADATAIQS